MNVPTVGRMVHYTNVREEGPCAAIIAGVGNDGLVNIAFLDQSGNWRSRTGVKLLADGESVPADGAYCAWPAIQQEPVAKPVVPPTFGVKPPVAPKPVVTPKNP